MRVQLFGLRRNLLFRHKGKIKVIAPMFWSGFMRIIGKSSTGKLYYSNEGKNYFPLK